MAVVLALTVALASLVILAPVARAATAGINATLLLGSQTHDGTPVVDEGQTMTLRVQYDSNVTPGSTVAFELGDNVTLSGVPAGNSAIGSVVVDGNAVSITFNDPWPAEVNQGVFDLSFTVNSVQSSARDEITWQIDGAESSVEVIVRDSGDQLENVTESFAKSATPGNLDSFVSVVSGNVVLDPAVAGQEITYTLRVASPLDREGFAIDDQLPAGMDYVSGSFEGQLTTWDTEGLNRSTAAFAFAPTVTANAFHTEIDAAGPSILQLTYRATITDVAAVQAALQAQYEALAGGSGTFTTLLTNTASFGGTERSASVRLRGTVAGANPGSSFAKTADWSTRNVTTDADGTLTPAVELTYTLKADLRQWTGEPNFTLSRNVVISDVLPTQAQWATDDESFITASGIILTAAATCPDEDAFAADAFVGQYCVDGQRLLVNVGKDNTTNASVAVTARLTTTAGLTVGGTTTVEDATAYRWRNVADFHYRDGSPFSQTRDVTVVALPDASEGLNDSSVFSKFGTATDATIDPGESVTMDYTFTLSEGQGIDARDTHIVDYVDPTVFDLEDPSTVAVSGFYGGQALDDSHFETSSDADGNLVIELSQAGKAVVTEAGTDLRYIVHITLTTRPFEGKVTTTITNRATLFGNDGTPLYWSSSSSEATSYGDEAEVRKRLYDPAAQDWVETLAAAMDGEGHLVDDIHVYRVQFIPHGSYGGVTIVPVEDLLPSAVEFLGFVQEGDVGTVASPSAGPVDIGGNLIASYDEQTRTVSISQKPGTTLDSSPEIATYFAVRVVDASAPIVNQIANSSATIVPIASVSVGDRVWVDTNRDGRQGDDEPGIAGVVLTLVGPDGEPVTDVDGQPVGPVTTDENGAYTFANLPVLGEGESYTVRIDQAASAEALAPYAPTTAGVGDREFDSSTWEASSEPGALGRDGDRDPTLDFGFVTKTYAIGDLVWVDENANGRQDDGEPALSGVEVDLLDGEGSVLDSTTTDDAGRYVFDGLSAGNRMVQFTLTTQQSDVYEFTSANVGSGDAADSDADPVDGLTGPIVLGDDNDSLTTEYEHRSIAATEGIDPTWDAGVVLKAVDVDTEVDDAAEVDDSADSDEDDSTLADAGSPVGATILLAAVVGVACGAALLRRGRRPGSDSA